MTKESRKVWGNTLFCDDIRIEIDQKVTIIGVYPTSTIVVGGGFPTTLARLGLFIRYTEEMDAFSDDGIIEIYFPGEDKPRLTANAQLNMSRFNSKSIALPDGSDVEIHAGGTVPILLSPVPIKEPGYVRVRLRHGGNVFKMGACEIVAASNVPLNQQNIPVPTL